ncbi:hypothetical protein ACYX7E_15340 [Luteimonas sp. RIT-PG2_3]
MDLPLPLHRRPRQSAIRRTALASAALASIVALALTGASWAQVRNPADPAPRNVQNMRPAVVPAPAVPVPPIAPVQPVRTPPAGTAQQRCIDNANSTIRAPAQPGLAASQRRLADIDQQQLRNSATPNSAAARNAQAAQITQQRQISRESNRVDQQLSVATRNCNPVPGTR